MNMSVQETLNLIKSIQAQGGDEALAKSITTGTGLVAYDLQAPSKNLYPVYTPLRNEIPRVGGGIGLATNWRVVNAIIGSGFDAMGWVAEGQRSGRMSYNTSNQSAAFVTLGEEDQISYEAVHAGVGFEDLMASMRMRLLQKLMLKEEKAILGGNKDLVLDKPATPTLSASGSGATLPTATYSVIVVALTFEGFHNSSLAAGVATTKTITGADGNTFTLSGGCSQQSDAATQAVTLGQTLTATTTPQRGAVAYAWFVGAAGAEKLEAITTTAKATFSAPLTGGTRQAATAITGDFSANPNYAFNGLATTAFKAGSNAYVKYLANGANTLTASGRGSVVEIDDMLKTMYDTYQLSPEVLYVNSQELTSITAKVLTGASSAPLLRFNSPANGNSAYEITAGGSVDFYYNPYSNNGGNKIPIKIHPMVPPGTIIGWTNNLPPQYISNNVPRCVEMLTRKDYYAIDWPIRTRQNESGVYCEEVLVPYAPFAMGVLSNVAAG